MTYEFSTDGNKKPVIRTQRPPAPFDTNSQYRQLPVAIHILF
jgi:hypothetical protein